MPPVTGTSLPISRKLLALIALPLALQVATVLVLAHMGAQEDGQEAAAARSQEVLSHAARLEASLLTMQASTRGYVLTHDPALADAGRHAAQEIPAELAGLWALADDTGEHSSNVNALAVLARAAMVHYKEKIELMDAGRWDAVTADILARRGENLVAQFRKGVRAFDARMGVVIAHRKAEVDNARLRAWWVIVGGLVIELAIALAIAHFIRASVARRLTVIADNARRLQRGEPLHPPLSGRDELAIIDAVFHRAAKSLRESLAMKERQLEETSHEATHDALTGLANRSLMTQRLATHIDDTRQRGRDLAVIFIDLDGFKEINDTHGHSAGDWVLREVANRLSHCVRGTDTVARVGGDEFVILLPNAAEPIAHRVAQTVLAAVASPMTHRNTTLRVSASVGLSLCPRDGIDPQALLDRADQSMYDSKRRRPRLARAA